jgi:endonuclease YncB( thermonuclease family)
MILQSNGSMRMFRTFSLFIAMLCIPALAQAADVTGVPKIRDGDQMTIGATRIRLAGMDSPGLDQLCLNAAGERWTCGVAAHEALVEHVGDKSWTCHVLRTDRFGRSVAKCEVDGEDISQWMVKSGWALSYVRFSHAYDADEKAAREAKAGLWAGAFFAPWDWRVRNKKTTILGSIKPPEDALPILLASASGHVAPSPPAGSRATSTGPASASTTRPKAAGMPRSACGSAREHAGFALKKRPKPPAAARPDDDIVALTWQVPRSDSIERNRG